VLPISSTPGTNTVTYTIPAANACPQVTATTSVTISTPPTGTLSYAGTPFCTSLSAPQAVTFVGTSGGTYSSTAGLTINPRLEQSLLRQVHQAVTSSHIQFQQQMVVRFSQQRHRFKSMHCPPHQLLMQDLHFVAT
jgi:hypothetical protein